MVAVSFMFSICTLSSYSPESERAAWRTKKMVSKSLVRTCTREVSTGAPPFVHTTWGRGLPWGSGGEVRRLCGADQALTHPDLALTPQYLEGDHQVDRLPHFADVGLAQVAGEADLGLLCSIDTGLSAGPEPDQTTKAG